MNKFEFKKLTPFKWFVLENFPFIEADFDALTEWQLFCKLGKEINKILNSQNAIGQQVENISNEFINLENYVNDYFSNLDIQDAVNEKLNEMAQSGELQEIITSYLEINGIIAFNTIADLKNSSNLINGSFVKTYGKNTYNDGEGNFYKIRSITNEDVIDNVNIISLNNSETLIAELIKDKKIETIEEITNKLVNFPTTHIGLERIFRFLETSNINSLQGGAITSLNTILVAMWDANTDTNKIMEINYKNGSIVKTANFSFGYCNGLAYDSVNNLIYIIPRGSGTEANQKYVHILNYNDFSFVKTITFEDYIQSASFDKTNNKVYLMNEWGLKDQNGVKIYEINPIDFSIIKTINLDFSATDVYKLRVQNFCVVGNYIYLISSEPRALIIYDLNGNLVKKYNLPEYINKIYYSGEYQFIDYLENQLYVGSGDNVQGISESINQLFKLDLTDEYINGDQNENTVHAGSSYGVFVDSNSTAINPNGTENNKFKSINEAMRYEVNNRGVNINIANGTYNGVYLRSKHNITFDGASIENTIINGFDIGYCNHVIINNATIKDCQFDKTSVINIANSDVYVKSLHIEDTEDRLGLGVGEFSQCNMGTTITFNVNNDNEIYVRGDSLLILNSSSYKIQKHNATSKIIGTVLLFNEDNIMSVGEFPLPANWNYTGGNLHQYFKRMKVVYHYEGATQKYIHEQPIYSSSSAFAINTSSLSGNGSQTLATCYIDFNSGNFRIRYSRIANVTASGDVSVVNNTDNNSIIAGAIVVDNVILE